MMSSGGLVRDERLCRSIHSDDTMLRRYGTMLRVAVLLVAPRNVTLTASSPAGNPSVSLTMM